MSILSNLNSFNSVSLEDLDSVKLMNRIDVKFAFNINKLPELLADLLPFYNVLSISGQKTQSYRSLYYDTNDRIFYLNHHNERVNRHKVRFREYIGSGISFLEVKLKNNKGKTMKKRIPVDSIPNKLDARHKDFITQTIGKEISLFPQQWIYFDRLTFVDKMFTERLTIDLNLKCSIISSSDSFENIVIAEVKKDKSTSSSQFSKLAKKYHILPTRISKYCLSTISLNPDVKKNRFKKKLLLINKIQQE